MRLTCKAGFLVLVTIALTFTTDACPNHQHDFREEGWGVAKISIHSKVKWIEQSKTKLIGITVSSGSNQGETEVTKEFYVKSAVTVCWKCRMATGMVFMTLDQLRQITAMKPVLEPLLQKAIAAQH